MKPIIFLSAFFIMAGCSTITPKDEAVREKAAISLKLPPEAIVVHDRVDSGVRTDFRVQTIKGDWFNCHITGKLLTSTRGVSEPVCQPFNKTKE